MKKKLLIYFVFVVGLLLWGGNVYATSVISLEPTTFNSTYSDNSTGSGSFTLNTNTSSRFYNYYNSAFQGGKASNGSWSIYITDLKVNINSGLICNSTCDDIYLSMTTRFEASLLSSSNRNQYVTWFVDNFTEVYFNYTDTSNVTHRVQAYRSLIETSSANDTDHLWFIWSYSLTTSDDIRYVDNLEFVFTTSPGFQAQTQISTYKLNIEVGENVGLVPNPGESGGEGGESGVTDITNSLTDIQDLITDDTPQTETESNSTLNAWKNLIPTNGVVSGLFLIPVNLIDKLVTGFNGTCQTFNLGNLLGTDLILPCIQPVNFFGSTLWGIIDLACCGMMLFSMFKKFVKVFSDITNLRDTPMNELYGGGR